MAETLRVNPINCSGHGVCAELLPELIRLDEWGYPIVDQRPVPPSLDLEVRRTVAACPTLALRLMRSLPGRRPTPRAGHHGPFGMVNAFICRTSGGSRTGGEELPVGPPILHG